MAGVARAGDDRQRRAPAADALGEADGQHRIVHRQDERGGMAELEPVDQFAARDVAELHRIARFARFLDPVDVAVDREIGLVVRGEHVGDHLPDAAEAEDDGSARA